MLMKHVFVFTDQDYGSDVPHTSSAEADSSVKSVGRVLTKPAVEGAKTDKMEESLTCVICQDLLHDSVRCVRFTLSSS